MSPGSPPRTPPPVWTEDRFAADAAESAAQFRTERLEESPEDYLTEFDNCRDAVEELLEGTTDLLYLSAKAREFVTVPVILEAVRYLASPAWSEDDLKLLADVPSLVPSRLRADASKVEQIIDVVLAGLDRRRFPWISESRAPSEAERQMAVVSTAALMATRRILTKRANDAKALERAVAETLVLEAELTEVEPRDVNAWTEAPKGGEFCREAKLGGRKADLIVGLWDGRLMPIECKASYSYTNSVKRLNNDVAAKAETWTAKFGTETVIPTAVIAGAFKVNNLLAAQRANLTIFWAHALDELVNFVKATR